MIFAIMMKKEIAMLKVQLVEHLTGGAIVTGSIQVEALFFFRLTFAITKLLYN